MDTALILPAQARAARQSLGLSLKQLSEATKINRSYLSMFENGKLPLAQKYQQALADFFTGRNVELGTLESRVAEPAPSAAQIVQGMLRRCFYLSSDLPDGQYQRAIEQMEANDERIAELLNTEVSRGLLSGLTAESETNQRELFGLLAGNYLLFRLLQGHSIVGPRPGDIDAKTQADLLADWFKVTLEDIGQPQSSGTATDPADSDAQAASERSALS